MVYDVILNMGTVNNGHLSNMSTKMVKILQSFVRHFHKYRSKY